jgi:transcriptional regulator with XRE-family HTH domain
MQKRIELILETENLTVSQFADKIGIQRSGMSHILAGRNKPSLDFVLKVLQSFPNLNNDWLLFGKGAMYDKNTEKQVQSTSKVVQNMGDLFTEDLVTSREEVRIVPQVPQTQTVSQSQVAPQVQVVPQVVAVQEVSEAREACGEVQIQDTVKQASAISKIIVFFENGLFKEFLALLLICSLQSL